MEKEESEEEHEDEDEDEDEDTRERRESLFHNLGGIRSRKSISITAKMTRSLLKPAVLKNGKVQEHGLLYINPWTGLFHRRGQEFDGSVDMADADSPPKLKRSRRHIGSRIISRFCVISQRACAFVIKRN